MASKNNYLAKSSGVRMSNLGDIQAELAFLVQKMEPGGLDPALNAIYQEFGVMETQRFKGGGVSMDFGGTAWEPITDQTVAWRNRWQEGNPGAPPLTNTGALRLAASKPRWYVDKNWLVMDIDPRDHEVNKDYSKDANYGWFHQEGLGRSPKREFVTITPEFVAMTTKIIDHYMQPGRRGKRPQTTRMGREERIAPRPRPANEKNRLKREVEREKAAQRQEALDARRAAAAKKRELDRQEKQRQSALTDFENDPVGGIARFIKHNPGSGLTAETELKLREHVVAVRDAAAFARANKYSPAKFTEQWTAKYAGSHVRQYRQTAMAEFKMRFGVTYEQYDTIYKQALEYQKRRSTMFGGK